MQTAKCECRQSKLDALQDGQPVQLLERWRHVIELPRMEDEPHSSMLYCLQSMELRVWKSCESRAAVVQLCKNKVHDE